MFTKCLQVYYGSSIFKMRAFNTQWACRVSYCGGPTIQFCTTARISRIVFKGPGKRGHIDADTLLPTQMFPRLPARASSVADTNFVSATQKLFLILFRNILCPQQMFPSLRSPRNIFSNNVSSFAGALNRISILGSLFPCVILFTTFGNVSVLLIDLKCLESQY